MPRVTRHLTYANVMATIAVFLALGGVSWAAVKLGRGAVKERNLATGAVGSRAVKDGSLRSRDFRKGELATALQGERGLQGAAGKDGAPGRDGAAVAAAVSAGPFPVSSPTLAPAPVELRWTQPPGAYDELRGEITTRIPSGCIAGGQVIVQLVADGTREISADSVSAGEPDANVGPDINATAVHV